MLATAALLSSLVLPSSFASAVPATALKIDEAYSACVKSAGENESARAECLNAALPQVEHALAAVVTALLAGLEANPDGSETSRMLKEAHEHFAPSRDADCRLRGQVISGDDLNGSREVTRECIYEADKTRLLQFERFLGFLNPAAD